MKLSSKKILGCFFFCANLTLSTNLTAATIITSDNTLTVVGSVLNTTDTNEQNINDLVTNNGRNVGNVTAEATLGTQSTDLSGNFTLLDGDLNIASYRDTNAGSGATVTATANYSLLFTVQAGETGDLGVNFTYIFESFTGDNGSSITWDLSEQTDGAVAGFGSSITSAATGTESATGTNSITLTEGTYTFSLSVVQDFRYNNSNASLANPNTLSVSDLDVSFMSSVPEPSSLCLLSIFPIAFLLRRKR
ncbi:MAG: PEP-CTERM sorting domain-containing protein [Akkermansiaceae bacterium]